MRFHRLLDRLVGVLAVTALLLGPAVAVSFAGGSASDNAAPAPWVGAPTRPARTPCRFSMVLLTPWSAQGMSRNDSCWSSGVGNPADLLPCFLFNGCESYSNAAVLGSEIWGYTWSHDSLKCFNDECSTADTEGASTEQVIYLPDPLSGCTSTISATLAQQFRWRVEGQGNLEVEVAGLMAAYGQDLVWQQSTISGGRAAFTGSRAEGAPGKSGGTLTLGKPPFVLSLPLKVLTGDSLPADEGLEFQPFGKRTAGPIPLLFVGEKLTVHGYSKVRSYADEAGIFTNADVQGWIRDSNPALKVVLTCGGQPWCLRQTTSRISR